MPKEYKVRQGNCILSIASKEGFFWETIWNDSANAKLKTKRKDPNILYPDDVVIIPDKQLKEESGSTESRHRFKKKGIPAKFRLIVERDDKPLKNTSYILNIDGVVSKGETDDKGLLEVPINPTARHVRLEISDLTYELEFGAMDPIDENTGVQARLQNLGFYDGVLDGIIGPRTTRAVSEFQAFAGLKPTGKLDDQTREKLFNRQDEEHEAPDESPTTEAPEAVVGNEADDPEDISDSVEEVEDIDSEEAETNATIDIEMPDDESDH